MSPPGLPRLSRDPPARCLRRWGPATTTSDDADAHAPGRTGHLLLRGVEIVRVEVWHLRLGDLRHLRVGDRADAFAPGRDRPLVEAGGLTEEHRRGRRLEDE